MISIISCIMIMVMLIVIVFVSNMFIVQDDYY